MKKLLSVSIMFVLLFTFSRCYAESEFTIHNGTKFGMSKEEIISLEKASGFQLHDTKAVVAAVPGAHIISANGKIASIENSDIYYFFDKDDSLYSVFYWLSMSNANSNDYNTVEDSLIKKYGNPNNDLIYIATEINYETLNYFYLILRTVPTKYSIWLVPTNNDNYVLILHSYYTGSINVHTVGYQIVSSQTINAAKESIEQNNKNNSEQLDNDL